MFETILGSELPLAARFFIAFLVSAAVWFTRNFSHVINRSRLTIHREYQHLAKRARP